MKKVLLNKSQQGLPKNNKLNVVESTTLAPKITQMTTDSNTTSNVTTTYMQRKSLKGFYSDLFSVLLRLPDKQVQQRVLQAINGQSNQTHSTSNGLCHQCKRVINEVKSVVNAETQTETFLDTEDCGSNDDVAKDDNKCDTPTTLTDKATIIKPSTTTTENAKEAGKPPPRPAKRGRKRKTCVPQVVKRSHAQQLQQDREDKQLTPIAAKQRKLESKKVGKPQSLPPQESDPSEFPDLSDFCLRDSDFENLSEILFDTTEETAKGNHILRTMALEAVEARYRCDGLLPIHAAIIENDEDRVRRQIYVWRKLQTQYTLNDLLTDDDEDCLELAIMQDSSPIITNILLEAKLCPNNIYEESNNVIHLAIINNIQLESLHHLIAHVDLQLLLLPNDSGYTPIHIAVRHNQYRQAEVICDFIDQSLLGTSIFKRAADEGQQTAKELQESGDDKLSEERRFGKYYEHKCDQLRQLIDRSILVKLSFKRRLLDAGESRGGSTALYFAVENEMEHLVYFLLAHLCNPDAENHSGQSAKSFHYEFARSLQLNIKLARVMGKITNLLDNCSNTTL